MRRIAAAAIVLAALLIVPAAFAHPLGNFTTNRYSELDVSGNRVYLVYVLDLAEIPTYQARAEVGRLGRGAYGRKLVAAIRAGVSLTGDGRRLSLRPMRHTLWFRPGAANLETTRLEALFVARLPELESVSVAYRDSTFDDRIGWSEVVLRSRDGARTVSSSVAARGVSARLIAYPKDFLHSPLDVRAAHATIAPGDSAGSPPRLSVDVAKQPSPGGLGALVGEDDLSAGVVLVALAAALFWGAAHALTPGHGKAIVAAYLVGTRGKARHAFILGAVVTVTHTIGVFALGLVTLSLSEFFVPEQLFPWLSLVSALLVVGVGVAVLRARWQHARAHRHGHEHHHDDAPQGLRGLVAVGVSGGLLPCPTALVVLLAAISLHRVGYGLLLIVAFSVGLASVVTAIGLVAVTAKRAFSRSRLDGRLVRALPAVSALVVLCLGLAMTARALPQLV